MSLSATLNQPITYHLTEFLDELRQIKDIQKRHQKESIAPELREKMGFVTAELSAVTICSTTYLIRSIGSHLIAICSKRRTIPWLGNFVLIAIMVDAESPKGSIKSIKKATQTPLIIASQTWIAITRGHFELI